MDIRNDLVKSALMEFIDSEFSGMEFSLTNVASNIVAKVFLEKKFDEYAKPLADENGLLPIDLIEKYGMEGMSKLKVVEIPKIGGKLMFKEDDFCRLMQKIKSKGEM